MKTKFYFDKDNNYTYNINTNIFVKIKCETLSNLSLAHLYFIDENNNTINIPQGFIIEAYSSGRKITDKPYETPYPHYQLWLTENYDIIYEDNLIITIRNNSCWDINVVEDLNYLLKKQKNIIQKN